MIIYNDDMKQDNDHMKYDHVYTWSYQTKFHLTTPTNSSTKETEKKRRGGEQKTGKKKKKKKKKEVKGSKKTNLMLPEVIVPIRRSTTEGRPVQTHVCPQFPAQLRRVKRVVGVAKRRIAVGLSEIGPQTICGSDGRGEGRGWKTVHHWNVEVGYIDFSVISVFLFDCVCIIK